MGVCNKEKGRDICGITMLLIQLMARATLDYIFHINICHICHPANSTHSNSTDIFHTYFKFTFLRGSDIISAVCTHKST